MAGEDERRILRRDPNPHLFRPIAFRSVEVKNRIMFSPMCQYWASDGLADDWHFAHLAARAVGGAGIVCVEATHVEPIARITKHCLGLWNDEQRDRLARIAAFLTANGAVPAIQLGHAGRKASLTRPWEGTRPLPPEDGGWDTVGPSPLPYAEGFRAPRELNGAGITAVVEAFVAATRRCREAGFGVIELHAGHGYLFHQFLSPLSNLRGDRYGGSLHNRARLLMDTVEAVRGEWPDELALFVRLSCTDWVEGGLQVADAIEVVGALRATGQVDLIDCTSGGNDPRQQIPIHSGYQIPLAEAVRRDTGMATGAVGLIGHPETAEEIVGNSRADLVVIGRALMANPYWPLHAAKTLGAQNVAWPVQYERSNIYN
jgi:2,4-dienoyl-CoA reductase-like NADH-dependent reductase (Old Yellow Enzyme family)